LETLGVNPKLLDEIIFPSLSSSVQASNAWRYKLFGLTWLMTVHFKERFLILL